MTAFVGFMRDTRYSSVPNAILGPLLAEIDSLAELKCVLRVLGMVHSRRGASPWVTLEELSADPILLDGLANEEDGTKAALHRGVAKAVARGTLLEIRSLEDKTAHVHLLVNDEQGRRVAKSSAPGIGTVSVVEPAAIDTLSEPRANIFTLYEENIGPITPLLADDLREAEAIYPWVLVQGAFKEAIVMGRRNWRYISRILERWAEEGMDHGESGRYSKKADPKEYLRRYGSHGRL